MLVPKMEIEYRPDRKRKIGLQICGEGRKAIHRKG